MRILKFAINAYLFIHEWSDMHTNLPIILPVIQHLYQIQRNTEKVSRQGELGESCHVATEEKVKWCTGLIQWSDKNLIHRSRISQFTLILDLMSRYFIKPGSAHLYELNSSGIPFAVQWYALIWWLHWHGYLSNIHKEKTSSSEFKLIVWFTPSISPTKSTLPPTFSTIFTI